MLFRSDDFMVKPFLPEEFLFRVFRNCRILLGSKFELKNGAIYDKNSLTLHINGTNIMLGKKEGLFFAGCPPLALTAFGIIFFIYFLPS